GKGKGKSIYDTGGRVRETSSHKAGLTFPVARIRRILKNSHYAKRISSGFYLAAVLEYLMAELLELAGNCARDHRKVRIIPRHILLAVRNDGELDRLLKHTVINEGGVVPFIHSELLRKSTKSSKLDEDEEE
ncbi:histone-fold-containing protein, partial [Mycena epipterygia]